MPCLSPVEREININHNQSTYVGCKYKIKCDFNFFWQHCAGAVLKCADCRFAHLCSKCIFNRLVHKGKKKRGWMEYSQHQISCIINLLHYFFFLVRCLRFKNAQLSFSQLHFNFSFPATQHRHQKWEASVVCPKFIERLQIFLSSMSFKTNGWENSNFHKFFVEVQNDICTFLNLRHL